MGKIDKTPLYRTYESLAEEIINRHQYKEYAESELKELAKQFESQFTLINQRLLSSKFSNLHELKK